MEFDWDEENTRHMTRHAIRPVEAEDVLRTGPIVIQFQEHGGEERILVLGQTKAGRLLAVVYTEREDRIRVVTAYPMTKRLEKIYFRER
jgi:uncharacterized DUF497 family protein